MDPIAKLPPEITAQIFSYLDSSTLLVASLASQAWRTRILDPRLWRRLYHQQGWGVDMAAIASYEQSRVWSGCHDPRHQRSALWPCDRGCGQPSRKKRATASSLDQQSQDIGVHSISQWQEQHGPIEIDSDQISQTNVDEMDQEMTDVTNDFRTSASPPRCDKLRGQKFPDDPMLDGSGLHVPASPWRELSPPIKPQLETRNDKGEVKINWAFLYKQRRKLEENWGKGRFTNFQLPHPAFPQEAHRECVYTIQFSGRWLVSGSRDKTLRIWDLVTRRLRCPPLHGHTQSVLCLQFDSSPKEDIIISGSSDTSVIIWQFSTGRKIKEIQQAHRDPVLNLRFDHRYLVTCSKDKLIKVWNRRELSPLDKDYPRINPASTAKLPSYIVDISAVNSERLEQQLAQRQIQILQPFSLLMALEGHSAAVNAIQIDQDQIVSASGDRMIKVWSLIDGQLVSTLLGHQKGIACVQFDSKRIVSGSSDHTVRIYDHTKKCEVAILKGHTNLVRTVQAGFGDLPNSDHAMAEQVRRAEAEYRRAVAAGEIIHEEAGAARLPRMQQQNCKSPAQYLTAFGAALPPGGGGSRWGRIVSGSYDETIIVWKKDADGRWVEGQSLRQETAIRAGAAADLRAYNEGQIVAGGAPAPSPANQSRSAIELRAGHVSSRIAQYPPVAVSTAEHHGNHPSAPSGLLPGTRHGSTSSTKVNNQYAPMAPGAQQALAQLNAHHYNLQARLSRLNQFTSRLQQTQLTPSDRNRNLDRSGFAPDHTITEDFPANDSISAPPEPLATSGASITMEANTRPDATSSPSVQTSTDNGQLPQHPQHAAHNQQATQEPAALPQQPASRVFKLQFDARRIVCCSQDPRIVGWDFAAGDPAIIEASQFFIGP